MVTLNQKSFMSTPGSFCDALPHPKHVLLSLPGLSSRYPICSLAAPGLDAGGSQNLQDYGVPLPASHSGRFEVRELMDDTIILFIYLFAFWPSVPCQIYDAAPCEKVSRPCFNGLQAVRTQIKHISLQWTLIKSIAFCSVQRTLLYLSDYHS